MTHYKYSTEKAKVYVHHMKQKNEGSIAGIYNSV